MPLPTSTPVRSGSTPGQSRRRAGLGEQRRRRPSASVAGHDGELGEPVEPAGLHPPQPELLRVEPQHRAQRARPRRAAQPLPERRAPRCRSWRDHADAGDHDAAAVTRLDHLATSGPPRPAALDGYRRTVETDVLGLPLRATPDHPRRRLRGRGRGDAGAPSGRRTDPAGGAVPARLRGLLLPDPPGRVLHRPWVRLLRPGPAQVRPQPAAPPDPELLRRPRRLLPGDRRGGADHPGRGRSRHLDRERALHRRSDRGAVGRSGPGHGGSAGTVPQQPVP